MLGLDGSGAATGTIASPEEDCPEVYGTISRPQRRHKRTSEGAAPEII
jgi:hypothetical protein